MAFFAARQPILNADKSLVGYELLFRTSSDNVFPDMDQEKATSKMIEGLQFDLGLDKLSSGKQAFINFTEQSILRSYPSMLPADKVVIEVLEDVRPTRAIFEELKHLHEQGYTIALDDFIHGEKWEPFYKICTIIKIDCQEISADELQNITELKARHPHLRLLAEKVENYEEFKQYKKLGFELFQGYFFSKPEVIKSVRLSTNQSTLASLLNEIQQPDISFNKITSLIEKDVGLSFKLLRYTQSPVYQRSKKIENIKQAVILLGKSELERFVTLMFAATVAVGKPEALLKLALHRAKFCELVANNMSTNGDSASAFLVGMLSLIDAMLDSEIHELLNNMPLSNNIHQALIEKKGYLALLVELSRHLEMGNWQQVDIAAKSLDLNPSDLMTCFENAADWAEQHISMV
ncbi:EAL and HDOD domain-containing protein [Glaciecola petra]|uniref:HDOD domain-containing protein n=1 Tax=Glaciecola petra TaxID=3075602 RepID=A0ABU2ZQP8_9ALTE|nr:HDOD domain-containing protein [Aestuariibacter sp. P117]MDT0594725.1 HDOD domain-containing protein [Aestuariibacter sp. P117]